MSRDTIIFLLQHLGFVISLHRSIHRNRIFEGRNQCGRHDNVPLRRKINIHNRSVQQTIIREWCNSEGINNSNWKVDFDISSSPLSSSTFSLITNIPDNKLRDSLPYEDKISLNAASLEELKWWYHNHGCSKIRWLEDTLPGTDNSESVEQGGSTTLHECLRNETSQIGYRVVFQGEKIKINSLTNRQHNSHAPLGGNCSNKERRTKKKLNVNLRLLNCELDYTCCRIPPKLLKHSDRLLVTPYQGLERVEIVCPDICKCNSDNGKTKHHACHFSSKGTRYGYWAYVACQRMTCNKNGHICPPMHFPHSL